jgi:hypothetical protein
MLKKLLIAGIAVLVVALARAQGPPVPGSVWLEKVIGNVERPDAQTGRSLTQIKGDQGFYRFENGEYTSILSRIRFKLPRIGTEDKVTVRESIVLRRADGGIATSHLVILPGGMAPGPTADNQAMSAVVVTRLRDDQPKDHESILRQWEPSSGSESERMRRTNIETTRVIVPRWGEAVQRVALNRASVEPFPYRMNILNSRSVETVGVSRYVVVGEDSLIEFSQIVPCAGRSAKACKAEAIASADRFMGGVVEFLMMLPGKKKE